MIAVLNITNKLVLGIASIISISLVAIVEWNTGYQLSFSVFYLIPLCFFALYENVPKSQVIINAIFAAVMWLIVEHHINKEFSNNSIPYWNAGLRLVAYLVISFLCYSLKMKQQELLDLNKRLNELNDEKNKVIGMAAHDLRNPFASIRSLCELMIPNETNTENLEFLEMINRISKKSSTLIDNLLNISRIEVGIVQLNIQPHDYINFIQSNIKFNQLFANNKSINIIIDCPGDELILYYDEDYLEQVLSNLITNAVKYSHASSEIRIKISRTDSQVLTEIIDHGVGIPENEINKLFKFFQQTSAKPTSGEKGSGLGLAIAKKIVTSHGGTIGVKSILNKGSTFFFYLPDAAVRVRPG